MMVLAGIAVIAGGFLLRFNPLLVVAASALVTGLAAGLDPLRVLAAFGRAFNDSRYVTAIYIVLPVIGLLERYGLQGRARQLERDERVHEALLGTVVQLGLQSTSARVGPGQDAGARRDDLVVRLGAGVAHRGRAPGCR